MAIEIIYVSVLVLIEPAVYLSVFLRQCYRAEPNKENYRSWWCNKQWGVYCFVRRLLAIFSRYRWRKLERADFLTEHNMMNGKKTDYATAKSVGETKDHQCKSLEKPSFVLELCIVRYNAQLTSLEQLLLFHILFERMFLLVLTNRYSTSFVFFINIAWTYVSDVD